RVTCNTVRPFLPGLLDPALETRIPTPITAHLDNCRACAEDLEAIKRLNLNRTRLYRLSQLFAEKPSRDPTKCSEMGTIVKSVAAMDLDGTTAEALKHLCKCPVCRNRLYLERQKIYDSLSEDTQSPEFSCESVSETDIFDYVMLYGLDPANDQSAESRESLTSHLRCCPTCLAKIQQLHNTVYGMAERTESEVVTIYHINESDKAQGLSKSDDLYAGFPISVEIAGRQDKADVEKPVPTIDFAAALKDKVSAMNLRSFLKAGIAAAAVILIGFAMLLNTTSAKAVTFEQIYKALEIVKNVHILKSAPGKTESATEIIEQKWLSQTLNKYMTKTEQGFVLWDITNKVIKTKQLGTNSSVETEMPKDLAAEMSRRIKSSFGLMPFYNTEILPDYEWHRVDGEIPEVAEGIEIYELKWTIAELSSSVFNKWWFFVDPKTNLPKKIEIYRKSIIHSEYNLRTVIEVKYLSDSEIQAVIKEAGF
ncbi:MAG: hypothetical protein HQ580_15640, partial [Planctomycetes bacterium]|nr:hypothetical protein [Planctomycetota bacterium]